MEDRNFRYCVVIFFLSAAVCAVFATRGSTLHCECSLSDNRYHSLDISCYNRKVNDGGVGCVKEERVRIPQGYRYIPGNGLYRFYRTPHHWTRARDMCKKDGGRLAVPRDENVARTLWDLFKFDVFVGISDTASEGIFTDVDGKLSPYLNWGSGEPNGDRKENCVILNKGGFLNDVNCAWGYYFVCERPFTRALPDGYEYIDNFGFFKIHADKANFDDAEAVCQAEGGHLFLVETYEEAEAITAFIKRDGRELGGKWTGLNDTVNEGQFMTYSGKSIDELQYVNWGYTEPNNRFDGGENCVVFYDLGGINDERCSNKFSFICEIPPP